ncbi:MAG: hypothetical protein HQK59_01815 [Deltaproteobacteria bacterium]|nr:hypothetical protein [Deltaproteobacteria bacterium]
MTSKQYHDLNAQVTNIIYQETKGITYCERYHYFQVHVFLDDTEVDLKIDLSDETGRPGDVIMVSPGRLKKIDQKKLVQRIHKVLRTEINQPKGDPTL